MTSNVTPLWRQARETHDAEAFERWVETGEVGFYGPAIRILLDKARNEILALRASNNGGN